MPKQIIKQIEHNFRGANGDGDQSSFWPTRAGRWSLGRLGEAAATRKPLGHMEMFNQYCSAGLAAEMKSKASFLWRRMGLVKEAESGKNLRFS